MTVTEHSPSTSGQGMEQRDRAFAWLVVVTGVVSWLASAILVLERLALYRDAGHTTSCDINPWVSCGTVMKSWQASLFGFPNPLIGIVGFGIVVTVGMALLAGARFARWYWIGFQAGITLAFAFCVWLWSQALYQIGALCIYCMVVWAMVIPLFVYTTVRNLRAGVIPAGPRVRAFAAEWAWVAAALLLVLAAGSVFLRFMNAFLG
ncbi:membrane protein [Zafaria cholistanensis]|uniref:Membrane protein n=2 Tax=Zafaria cholistanensis TaxID=1682741 RepID=A0A5A7NMM5_9MICC|nr:membrane protein [Zafaria cholistanensis]